VRWAGIILGALLLASCAFSSETPLFSAEDAFHPISDGATYNWRAYPDDEELIVRFERVGAEYVVTPVSGASERPMRMLLTDIRATHEDDYIAQVDISGENSSRAYAFLWPFGDDRYRVIIAPRTLAEDAHAGAEDLCRPASYGACEFRSGDDVRAYYLRVLYPALQSGQTPRQFIDIGPVGGEPLPPLPAETQPGKPAPK